MTRRYAFPLATTTIDRPLASGSVVDELAASRVLLLDGLEDRVCVGCGCTDSHACPGGCSWAQLSPPLCTGCVS